MRIYWAVSLSRQNCLNDLRSCYKLLQKILFYFAFKNTPNLRNQIKEKYQIFRSKTFKTILYKKSEQAAIGQLNGGGAGFSNLADTVNGDYFAIPPLKLRGTLKGTYLHLIEGKGDVVIGPSEISLTASGRPPRSALRHLRSCSSRRAKGRRCRGCW